MKLLEMLVYGSLTAITTLIVFSVVVQVATPTLTVVLAFVGAGAMMVIFHDAESP
jgi:hypothetical protein